MSQSVPSIMTSSVTSISSDSTGEISIERSSPKRLFPGSGKDKPVFCPITNLTLFNIEKTGKVFHFDPRTKVPSRHNCNVCVQQVTEDQLAPLYSVRQEDSNEYIIFMKNKISKKIEKFVLNQMGGLREVDRPDIEFNPEIRSSPFFTIYFGNGEQVVIQKDEETRRWKKMLFGKRKEEIPQYPVETLMVQKMKNENMVESLKGIHDILPYYQITYCSHTQKSILKISSNGIKKNYGIDENMEEFEEMADCEFCIIHVTENDLIPLYAEESSEATVIHVVNNVTGKLEKYIFNPRTGGFEEVEMPNVVYDRQHDTTSQIVLRMRSPVYEGEFVIHRNWQGRFSKVLSTPQGHFLINPYKVRTLQIEKAERIKAQQGEME